jgi:hypothetical protein
MLKSFTTFSLADLMTAVGLLLTVFAVRSGLSQWKADKTIRLLEEGEKIEFRVARKQLRDLIRSCPQPCDWDALIKEKHESDRQQLFEMIGPLSSYYNKLGVLLKMRVLVDELILTDAATNVVIFTPILRAWVEFVRNRRENDLRDTRQRGLNRNYGRGVLYLIQRCRTVR